MVHFEAPAENADALPHSLRWGPLGASSGLKDAIALLNSYLAQVPAGLHGVQLELAGDDRVGILSNATRILAEEGVSIEHIPTERFVGTTSSALEDLQDRGAPARAQHACFRRAAPPARGRGDRDDGRYRPRGPRRETHHGRKDRTRFRRLELIMGEQRAGRSISAPLGDWLSSSRLLTPPTRTALTTEGRWDTSGARCSESCNNDGGKPGLRLLTNSPPHSGSAPDIIDRLRKDPPVPCKAFFCVRRTDALHTGRLLVPPTPSRRRLLPWCSVC